MMILFCSAPGIMAEKLVPGNKTVFHGDVISRLNPNGIMVFLGGTYQHTYGVSEKHNIESGYWKTGIMAGLNPAYAQMGGFLEWQPLLFLRIKGGVDYYGYFGGYGSLASLDSPEPDFGRKRLQAANEKRDSGHRWLFEPAIRFKTGRILWLHQMRLAYYQFNGTGPLFYEAEYNTLLKNGDTLRWNTTHLMFEIFRQGKDRLMIGPYYEATKAVSTSLTRERLGAQFYQTVQNNRLYGQIGTNIKDKNRKNELFLILDFGVSFPQN